MDLLTSSRGDSASVQVALRIRPQGNREKLDGSKVCTSVIPNEPQVTIGGDRSFTYDNVFDTLAEQTEVYEKCIDKLVEGTFDGFNATVLAYGQTGSGKTYTMGTAFDAGNIPEELIGVVPRAVYHVFRRIGELRAEAADKGIVPPTFDVSVQFIELYNEEILDLLSDDRTSSANIRIHEDVQKNEIYLHGCANRLVSDAHQTLEVLKNGALNRTVAATNMNEQSSRSHAIFTMQIRQQRVAVHGESASSGETELEILTAKFHFVDLAGSERLKRTGATGDRAKEGISINCGLLALGNVISALGGASGKVSHVPYRDSKLTRLLQDSLGGNSRTLMIACVSPSDSDFVETLNTMKYANRAKNIKNKVVANQDKSSKAIGELRARIAQLETELLEYRQGRRTVNGDGLEVVSDQYHENVMLTAEVNQLRFRVKAFQETNEILRGRNVDIQTKLDCAKVGVVLSGDGKDDDAFSNVVRGYVDEVERIRSQLYESQATCEQLRRESTRWKNQAMSGGGMGQSMSMFDSGQAQLIDEARGDVEKLRGRLASIQANDNGETSDYASPLENTEEDATDEGEGDDEEELPDDENPETTALRENLADLQTEINIKERLISELERSERRLSEVRLTYERKLTELSTKIKATEAERDKMLADMVKGSTDKAGEERAKMIRDDYERKLSDMRHEFKKLQMIEREHKRMQARQEVERQQMMRYQSELKDLKKIKVDLVKKIRDEIKRAQQDTMKNAKKIAALDKEARKKDNQIRMLETKDKQREAFMKRTTEEVNRLRKAQRDAQRTASQNARAATRGNAVAKGPLKNQKEMFNPRAAKAKWMAIEKKLMRLVSEKQTVHKMEEELERRISERHTLLDQIIALEKAFVSVQEVAEREAIGEELEGVRAKLRYVQDLIQETQQTIASVDDTTKVSLRKVVLEFFFL
ncbi:unnamed protein product, partial [Mesorhabditis belari]|uniref:Kinesin-like protein n=1 Tax=Mesorhabditis belari TaxID=2138241 RepID=A0AAF3FLJ3_9BILA